MTESRVVTVFAAASMTEALQAIAAEYEKLHPVSLRFNFGASSTLARQIEAGAPAEVFVSAHEQWTEELRKKGLLEPESVADLVTTRLVVVTPAKPRDGVVIQSIEELLNNEKARVAVADMDHVPAGLYAREALKSLGWYDTLLPRVVPGENVRTTLMLVERGETEAGIVYESDARMTDKVRVLYTFPEDSHAKIRDQVALCRGASPAAAGFVAFLKGDEAKAIFEHFGFLLSPPAK